MARSLLLFLALLIAGVSVSAQTSLFGKVADDAGEPVILGNVVMLQGWSVCCRYGDRLRRQL
jgi:uncharacterized membrane protein YdcZ (DUF606 family)